MPIIRAACTDNRLFKLTKDEQLIGQLNYKSIFSTKALLQTSPTEAYLAKSIGVLQPRVGIFKDKQEIAHIRMQGNGALRIHFLEENKDYTFTRGGSLKDKYSLENMQKDVILSIEPSFAWKDFRYDYSLTVNQEENNILLLLIGLYGANYFINLMSGITAATLV